MIEVIDEPIEVEEPKQLEFDFDTDVNQELK
jgi:hypothetical protein